MKKKLLFIVIALFALVALSSVDTETAPANEHITLGFENSGEIPMPPIKPPL